MISHFLLVVGVGVLSFALRSLQHPLLQRLGTLGVFLTSFLAGWLIGGELWIGILFAASWLLLPWLEILTYVRRLRLPIERALQSRTPPTRNAFPGFSELTDEIENAGFEYVEDAGWSYDEQAHFFRLFYDPAKRTQASICLVEQGDLAFYYIALTSRGQNGLVYTTWNYPFAYGLQLPPRVKLNRVQGDLTCEQFRERHEAYLLSHQQSPPTLSEQPPEAFCDNLQNDLRDQIFHNLDRGLLVKEGETLIRYSARGMFFLWLQFLRDLIRLS